MFSLISFPLCLYLLLSACFDNHNQTKYTALDFDYKPQQTSYPAKLPFQATLPSYPAKLPSPFCVIIFLVTKMTVSDRIAGHEGVEHNKSFCMLRIILYPLVLCAKFSVNQCLFLLEKTAGGILLGLSETSCKVTIFEGRK